MSENTQFKVTLRGYDREAVDAYIRQLNYDNEKKVSAAEQSLAEAKAQNETLTTQLQESESLRSDMQTAIAGAQEFINAQSAKLKTTERELETTKKKNMLYLEKQDALTKLLADAQINCSKLVEEAQQHRQRIIAEAEQECQDILAKANASAAAIVGDSKRDADAIQSRMRERFSTITDTVAAIRQLGIQMNACCDAADQMIADPDSFFFTDEEEKETAVTN